MEIIPRVKFLGDWFREGDLGFLFAPRGLGKTWLGLIIAKAIAEGSEAGPWKAGAAVPVLYVDGEMPIETIQQRLRGLSVSDHNFLILNHEIFFERTEQVLNLTSPSTQNGLMELCQENKIKVLILDNLSCLFSETSVSPCESDRKFHS